MSFGFYKHHTRYNMKELKIEESTTKDIFVSAFKENNLVPILGAGFTVGMPTCSSSKVIDGKELKKYMITETLKKQKEICQEEIENENFSSVAELFEKYCCNVKEDGVSDFFYKHFVGVKINRINQLRFLNEIEWDYMYTLNIDTAIENSNHERWEVFYPNKDFDERNSFNGKKKLYKIHGDALSFIKSMNYEEMILTESQYIKSLGTSQKFHNMLSSDCECKNIIYIGCSLDDEIDIKYSVLSDKNRNFKDKETYRIYVTSEIISPLKKAKLEGFNISHYIQLQSVEDYELFYEFLVECFKESVSNQKDSLSNYYYQPPVLLENDLSKNIKYLADIGSNKDKLPFYYFESDVVSKLNLSNEKINVIIGRRFVGKTMLAYNILNHYQNLERFFVKAQESIDIQTIHEILEQRNALVVFDSDSIDDKNFIEIINSFKSENNSIVVIFINSYDDVLNLVSYHLKDIYQPLEHLLVGKMSLIDIDNINKGLDSIGIAKFDIKHNILDNTLRIANLYNENMIQNYRIVSKEELKLIIWLLVQNKMYYEELVTLGLSKEYKKILNKFAPLIQEEKCKKSEIKKHSAIKIVCNGKLGLLQILNNYAYPINDKMGKTIEKIRHKEICECIYSIMYCFDKIDKDIVKKIIMFDTLNDIFSRKYSQQSISYILSNGKEGRNSYGAAGLIQKIYSDSKIQQLKAGDPNYWLQRAKSVYITYYKHSNNIEKLYEGIKWAKKAEQDSQIKVQQGDSQYMRTMSNATIQIALMYGKVAKINNYLNVHDNNSAVEYYYKGLSDINNRAAAKSLMNNSKGTDDFFDLIKDLATNENHVEQEWWHERDYLLKIGINREVIYSS